MIDQKQKCAAETDGDQESSTIGRRPPHYPRDLEMARLRKAGWTYRELGVRYGLTKSGIQAALWRLARPRDDEFGLSARAFNALRYSIVLDKGESGPLTLTAIASYSFRELLEISNVGLVTASEIATMLWQHGIVMDDMPAGLKDRLAVGENRGR